VAGFPSALNDQVAREFAASQQYIAIAVYFDSESLRQLATHFYRQSVEERNHAMMIVQYRNDYLLVRVEKEVEAPRRQFANAPEAVKLARDQEREVTSQIVALAGLAREEDDLVGEQFLHWFLAEQREEVASMSSLLAVIERARDNLLLVEEYLTHASVAAAEPTTAPPAAGGAL